MLSLASSLSIAATPTSSSASFPLCNKIPTNLSFECSTPPILTHFTSTPIPKSSLKLKTHYSSLIPLSRSFLFRASAEFDSFQITEQPPETEEEQEEEEEGEVDEATESHSAEGGRLYVGNLPYAMTSSQLSEIFQEAGRIISVEIVYDRVTDRSRGFAFVTMGSVQEAKEAIRMFEGSHWISLLVTIFMIVNGGHAPKQVGGRTVKVNFPEVPRGGEREVMGPKIRSSYQGFKDSPHKIYAGNLSWSLTSEKLKDVFANQPGLMSAKVIYDRDSGRSQGFGFVTFASAEEVEAALNALNGLEVEGRPIRLNLAEERAPRSPPATPERTYENEV
ncbi:hypothetical protein RJ639_036161 [Escallonia herrerae]|uniref:RRM domain-containing protein n=1 Tax=Escallonia herrerae TaxID=1293975 RepID=A0AA88WUY2_9ASTE|nr:hypothetical protein RJ639_036161 [Escallonia herrerae]